MASIKSINGLLYPSCQDLIRNLLASEMTSPIIRLTNVEAGIESVLDYFLVSKICIWRQAAKLTKDTLLSTFIFLGDDWKRLLGTRFAALYLDIFEVYLNDVKGDDDYANSTYSLSVQLFTVPSIAVGFSGDSPLLQGILQILKAMFYTSVDSSLDMRIDFKSVVAECSLKQEMRFGKFDPLVGVGETYHYWRLCSDIEYLLTALHAGNGYDLFGISTDYSKSFNLLLDSLTIIQGMNSAVRQVGDHVTYEAEGWQDVLYISIYISNLIAVLADVYGAEARKSHSTTNLRRMLDMVYEKLGGWSAYEHTGSVIVDHPIGGSQGLKSGFHTISFPNLTEHFLPNRKVGLHPASLYNPLHWLYSKLLQQLPILSKSFSSFHGSEDLFKPNLQSVFDHSIVPTSSDEFYSRLRISEWDVLILDVPLQVLVFFTQVQNRRWIRNGLNLLRESLFLLSNLRQCLDENLFLIQFAMVKLGPEKFLTLLADRFDVLKFFDTKHFRSTNPEAFELEDFHSFLAILTTVLAGESPEICGKSTSERIRQEIIQKLVLFPEGIPYSKLLDLIHGTEDRKPLFGEEFYSLDGIIHSLTTSVSIGSNTDTRLFRLKLEYYDEVNLFDWHYTLNDRDRAREAMRSAGKRLHLPKVPILDASNPFSRLFEAVESKEFLHILFNVGWFSISSLIDQDLDRKVDERSSEYFIQLSLIFVEIMSKAQPSSQKVLLENLQNFKFEIFVGKLDITRSTSLLELYLLLDTLKRSPPLNGDIDGINHIINTIASFNENNIRKVMNEWPSPANRDFFRLGDLEDKGAGGHEKSTAEKKAIAEARKAAIMAKMKSDTQLFQNAHAEEFDMIQDETKEENLNGDQTVYPDHKSVPSQRGVCIICQEDVKESKKLFGISCCIQNSSVVRTIDFEDFRSAKATCSEILDLEYDQKVESTLSQSPLDAKTISSWVSDPNSRNGWKFGNRGLYASTCGHLMHYSCLLEYKKSVRSRRVAMNLNLPESLFKRGYLCPLCKAIGNSLLPVNWAVEEYRTIWNGSCSEESKCSFSISKFEKQIRPVEERIDRELSLSERDGSLVSEFFLNIPFDNQYLECVHFLLEEMMEVRGLGEVGPGEFGDDSDSLFKVERYIRELTNLWKTLSYTISSIELHYRQQPPVSEAFSSTQFLKLGILDCLDEKTQTLLVTLARNTICITGIRFQIHQNRGFPVYIDNYLAAIFYPDCIKTETKPLLYRDGFTHLTYLSMTLMPLLKCEPDDIFEWAQLFTLFEIIRSIVASLELICKNPVLSQNMGIESQSLLEDEYSQKIWNLVEIVIDGLELDSSIKSKLEGNSLFCRIILRLCLSSLLIFARKVVILMFAVYGFVPPGGNLGFGDPSRLCSKQSNDDFELKRLLSYLRIPSILEFMADITADTKTQNMIKNWCLTLKKSDSSYWSELTANDANDMFHTPRIQLENPTTLQLFRLPYKMEQLFPIASSIICRNCNTSSKY